MKSPEQSVVEASEFVHEVVSNAEWYSALKDLDINWCEVIEDVGKEVVKAMDARQFNYACALIEDLELTLVQRFA